MALKDVLIARQMWSQYLEVGIGPDAEVFTKAAPMSSVGTGVASACTRRRPGTTPSPRWCWR
jgi:fumarylacetoacetate (FAA) hydrolase family protein